MFHTIPENVLKRMRKLEAIDSRNRQDGTPRSQRLRQIPPETGRFIALLALRLGLAARHVKRTLTTFETSETKVDLARKTLAIAQLQDTVELVHGDAREALSSIDDIAFCFLDAEKDIYLECYEHVVPQMLSGGLLIADNAVSHSEELAATLESALSDSRVDAMAVPIGKGLLVCRRL